MALALRLTALSHVAVHANALWFQTGSNVGDWALATPTAASATLSPGELAPRTTPAPYRPSLDWQFQRRDDNTSATCGYPVDGLDDPPVTCGRGEYCNHNQFRSIVVCCTAQDPRDCNVPTTCLDSSLSEQWSGDPFTTLCDSARPHCVTQSYNASFYEPLYGASFVGCAAKAASGDIVATTTSESDTISTTLSSTSTTVGGVTTSSVISSSSDGPSTTSPPILSGNTSSTNVAAIAGGVVGGVASIALIAAAIFFLLKRRRKRQSPDPDPPPFGSKMPPGDYEIYRHDPIPGSQYASTFFGEAPPGMMQTQAPPPVMAYPPNLYGYQEPIYAVEHNRNSGAPAYYTQRAPPSKPQDDAVSPLEESPVSPVSPADNYNTMVSALSNNSPPLQPLQPAIHRPQSEYAQYSPPPPAQYQSYHPYPGT